MTRLLPLLLALGCQADPDDATTPSEGPGDTQALDSAVADTGLVDTCSDAPVVTWENFGAGFVTENCQACHASGAANRHGAPEAAVFDTEDDVFAQADRLLDRVVDRGDMPPQGGVTSDDRYLVEVWLRCG